MAYKFADSIQRGILYLLKSDKDFYLEIINLVKAEYFEYDLHALIFTTIVEYNTKYKSLPADDIIVNIIKETAPTFNSEITDELEYINSLDISAISNKNYFLDIIENFAKKEALRRAIANSVEHIKSENYAEVEHEVKKALSINRTLDLGQRYFDDVTERWERLSSKNTDLKFKTVFTRTNNELEGGPTRKELCMVVAGSGRGKSLYLVNQAVQALKENRNVLYISLEMSEDRIAQRFDSIMTCIPQVALKSQNESLKNRLKMFKEEFPNGRLVIKEFPTKTANVNNIRALMNQLQNQDNFVPDILILDYLELLNPLTDGMAEYQAQERIAQELRGVAMERNIVVWTASQVNRTGARAPVITDVDLADSYGKIRACDFAISLNQTDQEFDESRMRVYVMKSRNGRQRFIFPASVNYDTLEMGDFLGTQDELIEI